MVKCRICYVLCYVSSYKIWPTFSSGTLASPTAVSMSNVCMTSSGLGSDESLHHHHLLCWWHRRRNISASPNLGYVEILFEKTGLYPFFHLQPTVAQVPLDFISFTNLHLQWNIQNLLFTAGVHRLTVSVSCPFTDVGFTASVFHTEQMLVWTQLELVLALLMLAALSKPIWLCSPTDTVILIRLCSISICFWLFSYISISWVISI